MILLSFNIRFSNITSCCIQIVDQDFKTNHLFEEGCEINVLMSHLFSAELSQAQFGAVLQYKNGRFEAESTGSLWYLIEERI